MAECPFCNREMLEAESCSKNRIVYHERDPNLRTVVAPVAYGDETRYGASFPDVGERCHDCGVEVGGIHHPGCDVEESPLSGAQLLGEVISLPADRAPKHARVEDDPHAEIDTSDIYGGDRD